MTTENIPERRSNLELRQKFVEAYELIRPFFDEANAWAGKTHEHLAHRALHERFPELSGEEVYMLVTAAKRVFSHGGHPLPP